MNVGQHPARGARHRLVFESLLYGTVESASSCLRDHLLRARDRTLQRLEVLSSCPSRSCRPIWSDWRNGAESAGGSLAAPCPRFQAFLQFIGCFRMAEIPALGEDRLSDAL